MSVSTKTPSLDGIYGIRSEAHTNEEIVEEAADHYVLNNGIVGKLPPCEEANVTLVIDPSLSPLFRPALLQVCDIGIQICFICLKNAGGVSLSEVGEKILNGSGVGIDRFGVFPFESESFNKRASSRKYSGAWVMFPSDLSLLKHNASASQRRG
jgi:hypothetical protein